MRALVRDDRGFTIVETMAATLIIAIGFLGLAGVHALSSRAQSLGNSQGHAALIAGEEIEKMRRSDFADVAAATSVKVVDGQTFQISRSVADVGGAMRVQVAVSWTERLGSKTVTASSLVSQVTNP
ncbi:MAG: prepilin-type N-terminal cleavage/methylation domain-containing protein [Deltaproteobacteria bacterium]|nr:prepilin-type N-terminal cleavage/methylation domain-containing protein [Deltaproteobacteria bacterium]